jgi:hypothetical protein
MRIFYGRNTLTHGSAFCVKEKLIQSIMIVENKEE